MMLSYMQVSSTREQSANPPHTVEQIAPLQRTPPKIIIQKHIQVTELF